MAVPPSHLQIQKGNQYHSLCGIFFHFSEKSSFFCYASMTPGNTEGNMALSIIAYNAAPNVLKKFLVAGGYRVAFVGHTVPNLVMWQFGVDLPHLICKERRETPVTKNKTHGGTSERVGSLHVAVRHIQTQHRNLPHRCVPPVHNMSM